MKTCAACGQPIIPDQPYRQFVWAGFLPPGGVIPDRPDLYVHEDHVAGWTPPDQNYQDVSGRD
jgi:hypothetical protein